MLSFRLASLQETHSKFQTLKKHDTIQQAPPQQNMLKFSLPRMIKHFLRIVKLWNILMWIKERFQMKMNLRQMVKMSPFQVCLILNWWCQGNVFFLFLMFFSVFHCKVAKQNQVFHKYKPEASQSFNRCQFLDKNNSIERLNSSLSSGKSQ